MLNLDIDETWDGQPVYFEDESFLSWFTRLAKENCSDTDLLFQRFLPQKDKKNLLYLLKNLDNEMVLRNQLRVKLEPYVQVPYFLINQKIDYLSKNNVLDCLNKPALNIRYCPYCLVEDETPYFRNSWQLKAVCTCIVHHNILLEKCPHCYSPIEYWRTDFQENITTCYTCKLNITDFIFPPIKMNKLQIEIQYQILDIYSKGAFHNNYVKMTNIEFFQELWNIIKQEFIKLGLQSYLISDDISLTQLYSVIVRAFESVISPKKNIFVLQKDNIDNLLVGSIDDHEDHQSIIQKHRTDILIKLQQSLYRKKDTDRIAAFRYEVVDLLLKVGTTNKSVDQVAKSLQISSGTIWRWISKFRQFNTIESLIPQHHKAGRRKIFTPEMLNQFVDHYNTSVNASFKKTYLEVSTQLKSESDIPSYATVRRYIIIVNK